VLRDNYFQTQVLSVGARLAGSLLDEQARFIRYLEKHGRLNRAIEFLPDDDEIAERKAHGIGLTTPERAVLLAYSKMWLYDELLESDLPEDPWVSHRAGALLPATAARAFGAYIPRHPLKREIIATHVVNSMVNRVGRPSCTAWARPPARVRRRSCAPTWPPARCSACGSVAAIEALDNRVADAVQAQLLTELGRLGTRATTWFLRSKRLAEPMEQTFARFRPAVAALRERLAAEAAASPRAAAWVEAGVPATLAQQVAMADGLFAALDVAEIDAASGRGLADVAEVHAGLDSRLGLGRLRQLINALPSESYWQSMAKIALADDLADLQRAITQEVAAGGAAGEGGAAALLAAWEERSRSAIERAMRLLAELADAKSADLAMLSVALRELRNLA
jgi:glutamate dehydrogenase